MYLRHLYPEPKRFSEDESRRFVFGGSVTARVSGLAADCADRVKELWRRFCCDAGKLDIEKSEGGYRFAIGAASCQAAAEDSYALNVDERGLCVTGKDEQSLMQGIMTLLQLIVPINLQEGSESFYISAAVCHDAPGLGMRAVHLCVFPDGKLCDIEKAIHLAGFLKMTHVILEFWGTLQYDCMKELAWPGHSYSKEEIRPLVSLARSYGMELIPMANHLGHAAQSRACRGRHTVLNANLRFSRLFEPDGWTWCLSNPDTYKLLSDIRAEQTELFGDGQYYHLGLDEAYSFATCDKCRRRIPHELLAEYVNRLTEDLAKVGRRPIVWHDQFIRRSDFGDGPIVANGDNQNTADALDSLDRRVIIADWQYDYANGFNPTTKVFMDKGFDTLICPWDNRENVRSVCESARSLGAMGVILTTWHHLPVYLKDVAGWAQCAWGSDGRPMDIPATESACILRRLYDAQGDFERAGWYGYEVEEI